MSECVQEKRDEKKEIGFFCFRSLDQLNTTRHILFCFQHFVELSLFFGLEIGLGQRTLQSTVPFEIHEAALLGDRCLDATREVHRRLVLLDRHRRQVVHVDDDRP